MKKIICILVFLSPGIAFSQQWRPITSNEQFNYQLNTAGYISNVISVDSFSIQNGDTVFCLNRIVAGCPAPDSIDRLYNQPQFLERKMTRENGGVYKFSDPGEFWIKTLAGLNATWVFDSVSNITATVTSETYETVLTQWDSVKTITLSGGGIIRLSKDHGIIQFPLIGSSQYYTLKGIAGRNLGVLVPGFHEFYNFNVGDVFQYHDEDISYSIPPSGNGSLYKETIISKDSTSSRYTYGIAVSGMVWQQDNLGFQWDTIHYAYDTTEVFIDSSTQVCNIVPQGLVTNPPGTYFNNAAMMYIYVDTGQAVSRQLNTDYYPGGLYEFRGGDTLAPAYGMEPYVDKYTVGLGEVTFLLGVFEVSIQHVLIGYVKNGDTIGTVYPDSLLLEQVTAKTGKNLVRIYPNPVNNEFIIELGRLSGNTSISIYDAEGQQLITKQIGSPRSIINVSSLPAGVYFVRLTNDNTAEVVRFIKD